MGITCKHGYSSGVLGTPCYQCRCEYLEMQNGNYRSALEKLVALKEYKDISGKTEYYLREQLKAWEQARIVMLGGSYKFNDSQKKRGVQHCNRHGGYGFTSDCLECAKEKASE